MQNVVNPEHKQCRYMYMGVHISLVQTHGYTEFTDILFMCMFILPLNEYQLIVA